MSAGMNVFRERYPELSHRLAGVEAGGKVAWSEEARDVGALLDRWLSGLTLKADVALAVSGIGDGSHLLRLLEALPEGASVFCAEHDVSRFVAFLNSEVAVRIVEDPRVTLGVGKVDDSFFSSLASFSVMEYANAEPVIFAPLFNEAPDYYSGFFLQFARQLDYWRKLYGTNVLYSGLWQRNTLENLRTLVAAPDLEELKGLFRGIPMVVASAGPSLDESMEFLKWAQDRAVIVAGNSSFQALRNGGVDPHFVMAADPNPSTDSGFARVTDFGRAILLTNFMVYPKVAKRFVGKVATWAVGNGIASFIRARLGCTSGWEVTEHGTVSASAFDIAKAFGCPAVYFVGQDLALKADGQSHASDSFYADQGTNRSSLENCRWVPGTTQEKVPVEEKLFVYLKTFEAMAPRFGERMKLYNLSRLGAQIEGIPYLSIDDARQQMGDVNTGKVDKAWSEAKRACQRTWLGWGRVRRELDDLKDYVDRVCQFALKSALRMEGEAFDRESAEGLKAELDRLIASDELFSILLNDGQLKSELLSHFKAKRLLSRSFASEALDCEVIKSYLWSVAEGAYHLLASIDLTKGERQIAK